MLNAAKPLFQLAHTPTHTLKRTHTLAHLSSGGYLMLQKSATN